MLKGEKITFPTTPKGRQTGNFSKLVIPQILVFVVCLLSLLFAWVGYYTHMWGDYSFGGLVLNSFWILNNMMAMWGMIMAAFWTPLESNISPEKTFSEEGCKHEI